MSGALALLILQSIQSVLSEAVFFYGSASDQVLLNNLLQYLWGAGVIPDALRIHYCNGPSRTNLKAIHLRAIDERIRPSEV